MRRSRLLRRRSTSVSAIVPPCDTRDDMRRPMGRQGERTGSCATRDAAVSFLFPRPRAPMKSALLLALCSSAAGAPAAVAAQASPQIRTASGVIAGLTAPSGIREFRGVPFAAPPVRELRWQPPQPVHSWTGVRAADRFADQCMQARVFSDMVFRNAGTSEDCLYLNVWAPPGA